MQDPECPVCIVYEINPLKIMSANVPVSSHEDLDVSSGVETVKLVNELQHRPLDLVVTTRAVVKPRTTNSVDLVEEDDTRLLAPRHLEQLPNHTRTLTNVLLHELRANNTDESGVCSVGHRARAQGLAGTGGAEQKNTLRGVNTEVDKPFGLTDR